MTPEEFASRLRQELSDSLHSVVLYGSSVAGERLAQHTDYNVLVIVDAFGPAAVRAAGRATHDWVAGGNPPPLIFTLEEWRGSSDVFPMEYSDILEHHHVLHGGAPFDGITISRSNLRLQVEQDARGKLLHLRRAVMAAEEEGAAHLRILEQTVSGLMVLYRGLLRLHGVPHPIDYEKLTREAAAIAKFDPEAVLPAVRHARASVRIDDRDAAAASAAYLGALEQLVRHLDSLQ